MATVKRTARKNKKSTQQASARDAKDAVTLLKADHRSVEQLFAQYEKAESDSEKLSITRRVCRELMIHTLLEEDIFYPACRESGVDDRILDEAQVEHDGAKALIAELIEEEPGDEFHDAKVKVLAAYIEHHVGEEEKPRSGIFAKAKQAKVDMAALGEDLQARKEELMAAIDENRLEPLEPRALHPQPVHRSQEDFMPRNSNYRERDERGRFTDDDDDDRSRSRGYSSRGRDDDDDYRGRSRGHGGWYGDSEGHSQAARQRGGGSYSRSRRYEDDDDGRGRGHGGWFGDSEGHSEASRRGWEHSDHEGSGWYGDPQGHSQASRRGWERSDHEGSGWYGDPEGHSRASREGWDERGSSRSRGYSSRGRDDDDDYRGRSRSRGRSGSGWYGDPEGHSEASRRGWEDR